MSKREIFATNDGEGSLTITDEGEFLFVGTSDGGDSAGCDLARDQVRALRDALSGWLGDTIRLPQTKTASGEPISATLEPWPNLGAAVSFQKSVADLKTRAYEFRERHAAHGGIMERFASVEWPDPNPVMLDLECNGCGQRLQIRATGAA